MAKKMKKKMVVKNEQSASTGHYVFLLGVLLAILAGFLVNSTNSIGKIVALVLVVLGLIVGFINITNDETHKFLVAAIALLLTGTMSLGVGQLGYDPIDGLGVVFRNIFIYIRDFVAPAALVVSLKVVKQLAESK